MKLKYNNFIIITPVFILLGLILASFNYSIEKKELLWGLDEELKSIAVASTMFLKEEKEHIYQERAELKNKFDRILTFNRVKRLVLLDGTKAIVESYSDDVNASHTSFKKVKDYTESKIYVQDDLYLIDAYMPVEKSDFSLMVTLDASYVKKSIEDEFIEAIFIVCILSFIGVLISMLISFIVTNKIAKLNVLAQALANGKYSTQIELGRVQEFSDLTQTLNIMKSILQEMLFKTRNTYLQEDLFVNERELSKKIIHDFKGITKLKSEGIEVNVLEAKSHFSYQSYKLFEDEKFIYLYNFELKHLGEASIDMAIEASGANFYLEHNVTKEDFDIKTFQAMYEIDYLELFIINKQSKEVKQTSASQNEHETSFFTLSKDKPKVFNKNQILNKRYSNYIQSYSNLVFDDLCEDLKNIFQSEEIVVLIKTD